MKFMGLLWGSLVTWSVSVYWLMKGCCVLKWPTWLRPCLEETCGTTVARVATTSKCREKTKDLILVKELKEKPPPYVLLYPPLPLAARSAPLPLTLDEESWGTVTPVKSGLEASEGSNSLTSLSPIDQIPTPSPPVLPPNPPFNWGHLTSIHEDPSSPQTPTALQMSLREVQGPIYYDEVGQIQ
jgi:hypothetical protein